MSKGSRSVKRRTQAERTAETRSRLLQSAIDCICERGFVNTSTADIAARAGVTRGALQYHFPAHEDIIVAIVEEIDRLLLGGFAAGIDASGTLQERTTRLVENAWAIYGSDAYLALLEIWAVNRLHKQLFTRIEPLTRKMASATETAWRAVYADLNLTSEALDLYGPLFFNMLRGLAVSLIYRPEAQRQKYIRQQVKLICFTLTKLLEEYPSGYDVRHRP